MPIGQISILPIIKLIIKKQLCFFQGFLYDNTNLKHLTFWVLFLFYFCFYFILFWCFYSVWFFNLFIFRAGVYFVLFMVAFKFLNFFLYFWLAGNVWNSILLILSVCRNQNNLLTKNSKQYNSHISKPVNNCTPFTNCKRGSL